MTKVPLQLQVPYARDGSMQQLKSIFKKLSSDYLPVANQNIYFKYSVNTELPLVKGKKVPNYLTTVEVIAGAGKSIVKTPLLEIYNNGNYTVSIVTIEKSIQIALNIKSKSSAKHPEQLKLLEDTLFSMSKIEKNELIKGKNFVVRLIRLRLNTDGAKLFGIATVDFYVDEKSQEVRRMKIYYYNNEYYRSAEYTFIKRTQDYKTDILNKDFASFFLNSKGQLIETYKDYELNDYRKNSDL
ncbi:MAG: hypothetical protein A2X08_14585 [Bacteroidetes bacterium GWA2_32_17]|nr:MAG: hypothetical protein A2X08_14585 [Bacteroidetes bacterium GWA2_32_17]